MWVFFFFFLITGNFWGMRPSLYGGTDCSRLHRIYYYGSWCSENQAEMAVSLFLSNGILTQERATVETESENPTPAHFCTFSSKYKHSLLFFICMWSYFHSTCVFLGRISIKYLLQYSGHVKAQGAKSYKELDARKEQEVEWVKSGWAREAQKGRKKSAEWPLT